MKGTTPSYVKQPRIIPLRDYLLIDPQETNPAQTKSGIIIPERAAEGVGDIKGYVLEVGSDLKDKFQKGDYIIYNQRVKIRINNKRYHFVKEENILGKKLKVKVVRLMPHYLISQEIESAGKA